MADKIKIRRGLFQNLPDLDEGEFGLATDTETLYLGTSGPHNILINPLEFDNDGYSLDGYLLPGTDNKHNLGAPDLRWNSLYLGPDSLHIASNTSDVGHQNRDYKINIDAASGTLRVVTGDNDTLMVLDPDTGVSFPKGGDVTTDIGLKLTVDEHYNQQSEIFKTILKELDGYASIDSGDGNVSAPNIGATGDGYIAFFTGVGASIAGDNDLYYNRSNNTLTIGGGGSFISNSGTVSDPSFNVGNSTGIFLDSSNRLGFSVSGTQWWHINGVGTLSTTSGATVQAAQGNTVTTAYASVAAGNTGMFFPSGLAVAFATGGIEIMRMISPSAFTAGKIGIGITVPDAKLHVAGDGYFDGYLMPFTDNQWGLGTPQKRWRDLWVGPSSLHLIATTSDIGIDRDWSIGISNVGVGDLYIRQGIDPYIKISTAGPLVIGNDSIATTHTLTAGSVFVTGQLEVDGIIWPDSAVVMADEQALLFGGTSGDDSNIRPSASKAQLLFDIGSNQGSHIVFGNTNKDYDHAATIDPTLFIHSATDPDTNNTQWIGLYHDQSRGRIETGLGVLNLGTSAGSSNGLTTGDVVVGGSLEVDGTLYSDFAIRLAENSNIGFGGGLGGDDTFLFAEQVRGQFSFLVGDDHGRHMVFGYSGVLANDFGHPTQSHPTMFIHSSTSPATDNTQWLSLKHTSDDGYIETGKGDISLDPDGYVGILRPPQYTHTQTSGDLYFDGGSFVVGVTNTDTPRTVYLPKASTVTNNFYVVKDLSGNAGANNIIVQSADSGDTIDGTTNLTINANFGVLRVWSKGGTEWFTW